MRQHIEVSDEELLEVFAGGDDDALEELIHRHGMGIKNYAFRILRNEQDAEDVYLETFTKIFLSRAEIRTNESARGFLYTIAHRFALMKLRRKKTTNKYAPMLTAISGGQNVQPSAEERVSAAEMATAVERAIANLSVEHRQVLLLRTVHGLTTKETATAVGRDESQVRSQLSWARKRIRAITAEELNFQLPLPKKGGGR